MLVERIKKRIEEIQREPEHVRLQIAIRYTIIFGIVIAIVWLAVFLPLQIRQAFQGNPEPSPVAEETLHTE